MVREARDAGQTVFLSSHVISEIEQVADEVAVLRDGRIVDVSTVDRLRAAALRDVRVTVPASAGATLASRLERLDGAQGVTVVTAQGHDIVSARLREGIPHFLAALTEADVLDLVVQEPDLERAVLQFYGTASSEEATA